APVLPPWATTLALGPMRRLGVPVPPEMLGQLRFGRGLDNRKLKASGFSYRYTSRETALAFAEHTRLASVMRGTAEPYRYEREVEDFLRWSPNVRNPSVNREHRLTPAELLELRRLHAGYAARTGAPGTDSPSRQAQSLAHTARAMEGDDAPANGGAAATAETAGSTTAPPTSIEHYDDLTADEIVPLVESLESPDLLALRDHERAGQGRPRVLAAIDGVLVRRESRQP
ncbi:MAG TPA: hypothetical protein VF517_14420, partial [Thermoleophilaceae bacterium]